VKGNPVVSNPFLALLLKVGARDIAKALYRGILGREPDAPGLEAYTRAVRRSSRFENVLRDIASSDEHWALLLSCRADALADVIVRSLGANERDTEAVRASLAAYLRETSREPVPDKASVSSAAVRHGWFAALAPSHVAAIFQVLLGRAPDSEGEAFYSELARQNGSLSPVLEGVAGSSEHWQHLLRGRLPGVAAEVRARLDWPDELKGHVLAGLATHDDLALACEQLLRDALSWEPVVVRHGASIVREMHDALLGRGTSMEDVQASGLLDSDELSLVASATADLHNHGSISMLLDTLGASDVFFRRGFERRASAYLDDIFLALLGRVADEAAITAYLPMLMRTHRTGEVVAAVASSDEFWVRQQRLRIPQIVSDALAGRPLSPRLRTELARTVTAPVDFQMVLKQWLDALLGWDLSAEIHGSRIVEDTFNALLHRSADPGGLDNYMAVLRESGGVERVIHGLTHSVEFRALHARQLARTIGHVLSEYRPSVPWPGHLDLASVDSDEAVITHLVRALDGSSPPRMDSTLDVLRASYRGSQSPRLGGGRRLALLFLPSEGWLAFCLAVADYLQAEFGCHTALVWEQWSPAVADACDLSASVHEVIGLEALRKLEATAVTPPALVVTHSFGWVEQTSFLLDRFPRAKLYVYGDGFKNEVSVHWSRVRPIEGALFFAYQPQHRKVASQAVIPAEAVHRYLGAIADRYDIPMRVSEPAETVASYAVVYIRYWGVGPYAFEPDDVVRCVVKTIRSAVDPTVALVLKDDARARPEFIGKLIVQLRDSGYSTTTLQSFLETRGADAAFHALPAEYLFSKGLLTDACAHFVFDSSLSYIIATSPLIHRPTTLVIGGALDELHSPGEVSGTVNAELSGERVERQLEQERGVAERSLKAGLDSVMMYSNQYLNAVLHTASNAVLTNSDGKALFSVELRDV
jgi:hypothetical protein